jgi:hypothetical protein
MNHPLYRPELRELEKSAASPIALPLTLGWLAVAGCCTGSACGLLDAPIAVTLGLLLGSIVLALTSGVQVFLATAVRHHAD